jgi:hypothetical protein
MGAFGSLPLRGCHKRLVGVGVDLLSAIGVAEIDAFELRRDDASRFAGPDPGHDGGFGNKRGGHGAGPGRSRAPKGGTFRCTMSLLTVSLVSETRLNRTLVGLRLSRDDPGLWSHDEIARAAAAAVVGRRDRCQPQTT